MSHIEVKGLSVVFQNKITAVDNVSFQVEAGEIYGIVGLSGAGKSTLIRTLNLLQRPTTGEIWIDGQEISHLKGQELRQVRQKIGMIFQHFNLIENRTIAENIEFSLKAGDYPKEKRADRVAELLSLVDLLDKKDVYPNQLSGGQKQRVGIARALANNPEVLLCDEATSALDVETTEEILKILEKINRELGLTIIFITHELDVAKRLFKRVAVMEQGKIIEEATTFEIFAQPQAATTQKLVGRFFDLTIPQALQSALTGGVLLELRYQGAHTLDPLISQVSKDFNVLIGIIHGKIEYIQEAVIGILFVQITGEAQQIQQAVSYLKENVYAIRDLRDEVEK
ncbi:D-methionine transport system ATP-binding protein [Enterococcus sp. PF1-24]|uniref:methionine ABC transporter ATP-binding protein n=1 Tax=unclassified Enterococcus TaxID=2608891 RepID=UPI002474AF0C|nr:MULTISPECIES: ATP-binding cassette domain-containing protein [unclassified Enterococcus]MDH6364136.1 D-methionine transport system ATP-binding protein [Enterococcus sp. PFB1-1]MDH6401237.1 D-methionine transport system ATP-binding protein [Enterococcus sp. PF1-24]